MAFRSLGRALCPHLLRQSTLTPLAGSQAASISTQSPQQMSYEDNGQGYSGRVLETITGRDFGERNELKFMGRVINIPMLRRDKNNQSYLFLELENRPRAGQRNFNPITITVFVRGELADAAFAQIRRGQAVAVRAGIANDDKFTDPQQNQGLDGRMRMTNHVKFLARDLHLLVASGRGQEGPQQGGYEAAGEQTQGGQTGYQQY